MKQENPDEHARELGMEFYQYWGDATSEFVCDFCRERAGKYFHFREILEWGEEFKNIHRSICGCSTQGIPMHGLGGVSVFSITKEDFKRIINKGLYKMTKTEKEFFEL